MSKNVIRGLRARARGVRARWALLIVDETGMSTVEYAIGTIAAAAFGAILYSVVTGDSIVGALTNLISRALTTNV
ncbi:DUF4244 domain-containing protein [Mycolicibacterium grossiae]|uniref:DUF4244 domain-containing protein n=1 Tax=Mycolicibacterium grossiae TaxID=1552759 RepID=UPI0038994100